MKHRSVFLLQVIFVALLSVLLGVSPIFARKKPQKERLFQVCKSYVTVADTAQSVTLEFPYHNTLRRPVYIADVRTDCGCTAVEYSADVVAPDAQGCLSVTIDLTYQGPLFERHILVYTNKFQPILLTVFGHKQKTL